MLSFQHFINALPRYLRRHSLLSGIIRFYPRLRIQTIQFNDAAKMRIDLSDAGSRQLLITGVFDPEFFEIATPFLVNGGVFFDVGANLGGCTFGLIPNLRNRAVEFHLFEAHPHLCELLKQSADLSQDSKIFVCPGCVIDRPGTSKLAANDEYLATSFISNTEGIEVKNIVLDDYIKTNNVKSIDFLKLDIEGCEPHALKGLQSSLRANAVKVIYFEVGESLLARHGFKPESCFKLLRDAGFELFFCKDSDFRNGIVSESDQFYLTVNGARVKVAPMKAFPRDLQTDLLAINSKFLHDRAGERIYDATGANASLQKQ